MRVILITSVGILVLGSTGCSGLQWLVIGYAAAKILSSETCPKSTTTHVTVVSPSPTHESTPAKPAAETPSVTPRVVAPKQHSQLTLLTTDGTRLVYRCDADVYEQLKAAVPKMSMDQLGRVLAMIDSNGDEYIASGEVQIALQAGIIN